MSEISQESKGHPRAGRQLCAMLLQRGAQARQARRALAPEGLGQDSPELAVSGLMPGSALPHTCGSWASVSPDTDELGTGAQTGGCYMRGEPCRNERAQWMTVDGAWGPSFVHQGNPLHGGSRASWEQSVLTGTLSGMSAPPLHQWSRRLGARQPARFPAAGRVISQVLSLLIQLKRKSLQAAIMIELRTSVG